MVIILRLKQEWIDQNLANPTLRTNNKWRILNIAIY